MYGADACATCSRDWCCPEASACSLDPACATLAACERQCAPNDDDCLLLCELDQPTAVADERALGTCATTACPTSCLPPQWACRDNIIPIVATTVEVALSLHDYQSGAPLIGAATRVCDIPDQFCANVSPTQSTDAQGGVVVAVDGSHQYIQVLGARYVPLLIFVPPLSSDVQIPLPVPMQADIELLEAQVVPSGIVDPTRGAVISHVLDCGQQFAAWVALSLKPSTGTTSFYFVDMLPSPAAMETDSIYAAGGFFGTATLEGLEVGATVVANGLQFPPMTVFTRPAGLSVAVLYANPP